MQANIFVAECEYSHFSLLKQPMLLSISCLRLVLRTALVDSLANRKTLKRIVARVESEITLRTFDYVKHFPNSSIVKIFKALAQLPQVMIDTSLFQEIAQSGLRAWAPEQADSSAD